MSIKTVKFIDIRKVFKTEDRHFTVWLENNISALEDVLPFRGIEVSEREMSVGPFSVDLVCQDFNGELIAIENQFGKTDHDHLGKLLTYAINLEGQNIIWISSRLGRSI